MARSRDDAPGSATRPVRGASRKPMHRRIFDELEASLRQGAIVPGARLPTEAQLSKKYGTSRTTAIRALRDLAQAGLVQRRQGSGTYAVDVASPTLSSIAFCALFVHESSELGHVEGLIQRRFGLLVFLLADAALLVLDFEVEEFVL